MRDGPNPASSTRAEVDEAGLSDDARQTRWMLQGVTVASSACFAAEVPSS